MTAILAVRFLISWLSTFFQPVIGLYFVFLALRLQNFVFVLRKLMVGPNKAVILKRESCFQLICYDFVVLLCDFCIRFY